MMLEPAHCAGDAPRTAPEQGRSPEPPPPGAPPPPDRPIRLPAPEPAARMQAEREQWLWRRSLERQLHDGAALRISALTLQLGLFRHHAAAGADLDSSVDGLQDELHAVLQDLRAVAARIYPPLLDEAGLGPALRELADRLHVPVRVQAPADRFGPAAEGTAYFAVAGCLEAAAPGGDLEVRVRRDTSTNADVLVVDVAGVDLRRADGMLALVRRLDGTIDVAGAQDAGTITARIPCE